MKITAESPFSNERYEIENRHLSPAWVKVDEFFRRTLDIVLSLFGMIILSPVFLAIALLVKNDSSGPVFYHGPRVGRNGKLFNILKFRTMYERVESYAGPRVTAQDDPRITPIGKILRDTKINELPQLWNVFIGDMSLVGPRPEDPQLAKDWPEELRRSILTVKPGVTSPASVLYRDEETLLQSKNLMDRYLGDILPSKLRLDQLYVRNRTVMTDMDVLFWTVVVLLPRLKNVAVPEHLLYWGPLSVFFDRYVTWFLVDILVSFTAVATAGVIWRASAPLDLGILLAMGIAFTIAFLFSIINALMGLNRIAWSAAKPSDAMDLGVSSALVTLVLFVLNLLGPEGPLLPPSMLVVAGTLSLAGFIAVRYRTRLLTGLAERWITARNQNMSFLGEPVLIIGCGELARFTIWLLRNSGLSEAFNVVGLVDDDPRKIGMQVEGLKVIGVTQDIPNFIQKHDIGLIMFAISNIQSADQERILGICRATNTRIILVPDIMDSLRAHFPADSDDRDALMGKVVNNSIMDRATGTFNRQHFLRLAEAELPRSRRYRHPLSFILFRVGFTKPQSVAYGRPLEGKVLHTVVDRCRKNTREIDILSHFDGNEFAIMLPETSQVAANFVGQRIRFALMETPAVVDGFTLPLEVTMGVVTARDDNEDIETLINYARSTMVTTAQETTREPGTA